MFSAILSAGLAGSIVQPWARHQDFWSPIEELRASRGLGGIPQRVDSP